jgi:molecular chaperone GrpE
MLSFQVTLPEIRVGIGKDLKSIMNESKQETAVKINISPEGYSANKQEPEPEKKETPEKPIEKLSKAELLEKVTALQEEAEKKYDLYLRSQAEMENLKRRSKKEKEDWLKYANESLIKELLPVLDNLEKAIEHSQDGTAVDALREGVELTLKGLKDSLEKSGLKEVKALGEPFDPCFHQAVSEQEDEFVASGSILIELQKGYTLNDRLIRPAMVVVSKGGPGIQNEKECKNE